MALFPLATFTSLDWSIIVLYLGAMVLIGHVVGRKKTDAKGYFLGDRSSPTWAVVLSIIATSLSAATFLGAPQEAFRGDLTYLILNVGSFIGVVIVAVVFIPRFYAAGTVTIYGYLNRRFGEPARIATSTMFLIGRLLASGARLFMAAGPVCLLLFHPDRPQTPASHNEQILAILLIGAIGIAYTVSGGIKAHLDRLGPDRHCRRRGAAQHRTASAQNSPVGPSGHSRIGQTRHRRRRPQ